MGRFILHRLLIALLQLAGLTIAVFFIIRMLPADPVAQMVGLNASPEAHQQSAHMLGVDRTPLQQFANFLGVFSDTGKPGLLQGSLGTSWVTSQPIWGEQDENGIDVGHLRTNLKLTPTQRAERLRQAIVVLYAFQDAADASGLREADHRDL